MKQRLRNKVIINIFNETKTLITGYFNFFMYDDTMNDYKRIK